MEHREEIQEIRELINCCSKSYINEELGINDNVIKTAKSLGDYIRGRVPYYHTEIDENGIIHKKNVELITCFGASAFFDIDVIVFKDEKEYDKYVSKYNFNSNVSSYERDITLTLGMIGEMCLTEIFYGTIQHELAHFYNKLMSGGIVMNRKDGKLYRKISDRLKDNTISDDECKLLTALYRCCFDDEINAHANNYYASIKASKGKLEEEEPIEFVYLKEIRKVIDEFDVKYRQYCEPSLGMSPERVKCLLDNGIIEYARQLGRARARWRKDKKVNEDIHINIVGKLKKLVLT